MLFKREEKEEKVSDKELLRSKAARDIKKFHGMHPTPENMSLFFNTLKGFLIEFYHFPKTSSLDDIEDMVAEKHMREGVSEKLRIALESISRIRYAGIDLNREEFNELIEETAALIKEL